MSSHGDTTEPCDDSSRLSPVANDSPSARYDDLPAYQSTTITERTIVEPRAVIIDGVLIFPADPPANALYQFSRDLIAGTKITISRIDHEVYSTINSIPRTRIRDRPIYLFEHRIFQDSAIELIGQRRDTFNLLLMTRVSSFKGDIWNVASIANSDATQGTLLLSCRHLHKWLKRSKTSHEWTDSNGRVVAVEEVVYHPNISNVIISAPSLRVVEPLEQKMHDLLVTAWAARVWNHHLRSTGQIRLLSKGKNAYFKTS